MPLDPVQAAADVLAITPAFSEELRGLFVFAAATAAVLRILGEVFRFEER